MITRSILSEQQSIMARGRAAKNNKNRTTNNVDLKNKSKTLMMMTLKKEMQDGVQVHKGQLKTLKERRDKKDKADTNTDWEARCSKVRTNTQNCF